MCISGVRPVSLDFRIASRAFALKEQYVGDINDYRKYALLRRLAAGGLKIGVCWMLTAPDDRNDGRKLGYLDEPERWRGFDPELFDALHPIAKAKTNRRLQLVERGKALPRALFFNECVPTNVVLRRYYFEVALEELTPADIVFYDPDNGIEVKSTPRGAPDSPKFIYRDEIAATYGAGMKAKALYDSKQVSVYVRYAYVAGEVWIDLGDQSGAAVRITSNGWTIESTHDVVFRRPSGMRALPHPIGDGSIDELRRITALDDDNWKRFVAFLLNCLYPLGPFMLLLVEGQQGTGKSVLAGAAKQVIDPHQLERIRLPGNEHDLVIQASHSWLLAFDNASHVRNDVSDALCALATGTSYGTRKYYTDNELRIICAKRPVMINGIGEFARRPDLLDRSITLSLSELPGPRRTESQIFGELAAALPSILGVLYDGVAHALRSFKAVELKQEFRMIDAGRWITAAEGYFGFKAGELVSAIKAGQLNTLVDVTANDPLVIALNVVIKDGPFVGMISQLYGAFQALELNRQSGIPKTPPLLSNALRRLAPAASAIGLKIELTPRSRKGREVRVWREGQDPDKQRGTWTLPDFMGRSV